MYTAVLLIISHRMIFVILPSQVFSTVFKNESLKFTKQKNFEKTLKRKRILSQHGPNRAATLSKAK